MWFGVVCSCAGLQLEGFGCWVWLAMMDFGSGAWGCVVCI